MTAKNGMKRTVFKLHAPDAKSVMLAGSFNDWDAQLQGAGQTRFFCTLTRYLNGVGCSDIVPSER